jgi:hypothetical protein
MNHADLGHTKRIEFSSINDLGQTFAEAVDITPRGGGLTKVAGQKHPEICAYLRDLRPDPRYQYVLMTPMGAYEVWGMNVNGDIFPRIALSHDLAKGDPVAVAKALEEKWLKPFGKRIPPGRYVEFGYKTFLKAERYRHHVNKNPELSYGSIVLSVWNPNMHRVEVIVRHDREKAKRVGAEEIILDLDAGKPRQISMGCKVPFDVCTKCGHISRTPRDYCEHLRYAMGKVNPDGTLNGAVNFFPRFFDLSDVIIPAAKESGVLQKVAHVTGTSVVNKWASQRKTAEIEKEVLPNSGYRGVRDTYMAEKDLPRDMLTDKKKDLHSLVSTLASLGIILKPHEFQDAALCRMGHRGLADELHSSRQVFRPRTARITIQISGDGFSEDLAGSVARRGLLRERSGLYPHLPRRVVRIVMLKKSPPAPRSEAPDSEPLKKVAEAYDAYRRAFRDLPGLLDVAMSKYPEYYHEHFFSDLLTDTMTKTAASDHGMSLSTPLVPLYVYNAYRGSVSEPPPQWRLEATTQSPARALLAPAL